MEDGSVILADTVLSGASPYTTFIELMDENSHINKNESIGSDYKNNLNKNKKDFGEFKNHISHTDFSCGAFKINCAVDSLPNFTCYPSPLDGSVGPMHRGNQIIFIFSFYFYSNFSFFSNFF